MLRQVLTIWLDQISLWKDIDVRPMKQKEKKGISYFMESQYCLLKLSMDLNLKDSCLN